MDKFRALFAIPDLRKRLTFTFLMLAAYSVGRHIILPGVDPVALGVAMANLQNTLFGLYDMFAGGAFGKATVFALGIMPYISASIIIQLLGAVFPYFQKLQKEGEEGRKKITQYTRWGTVGISTIQAFGVSKFLESMTARDGNQIVRVIPDPGIGFELLTVVALVSGTILIMWLGEQITERGIGNGISIIIMVGIIAQLPAVILQEVEMFANDVRGPIQEVILIGLLILIVGLVVYLTQGTRKVPVQYARRVVGRKIYGGQATFLPIRVNTAGVMPIIFAQSIMFVPNTIGQFSQNSEFIQEYFVRFFDVNHPVYWFVFGVLIMFFTYFYTAMALNPVDVADNMKKSGGYIPGVRPGKKTSQYIDNILTKVTLPGAIFLAFISIFPYILMQIVEVDLSLASFFGGTSLLIIVGVALDTTQQIESHLLTRHYDGFLKSGRLKGRMG